MIRHYLLYSFRSLFRFRSTSVLQLIGFLVGLGAFIPVGMVLHYYLSFDEYHQMSPDIVRISTSISLPSSTSIYAATSKSLAPLINEQLSPVKEAVRCRSFSANIGIGEKRLGEELPLFADKNFFKVFFAEPLLGDPSMALEDPQGVVITASAAERFFGKDNPLGQVISVETTAGDFLLTVKAVVKDYPENVSFRFRLLANFSLIDSSMRNDAGALVPGLFTYALLDHGAGKDLSQQLDTLVASHFPEGLREVASLVPIPYGELHYTTGHQFDTGRKGSRINNLALGCLGIFLLLISIVNYVNLSTALFIRRSKELAIRRIMGEGLKNQYTQLLMESMILMFCCLSLLGIMSYFFIPKIETFTNLDLSTGWLTGTGFYLALCGLGILVAVAGSIYPLVVSSRQGSVLQLRGSNSPASGGGLRYSLLALQLVVSIGFAVIAMGMDEQFRYIRNKDLGFDKEQVFTLGLGVEINHMADLIRQKLEQLPFVKATSISLTPISGDHVRANFRLLNDTTRSTHLMNANYVDHNFLQVYGVRLQLGRSFDKAYASDVYTAYVLNKKATELLGFSSPEEALNQPFGKEAADTLQKGSIVGIVDDYHFLPLYREVEPMVWQVNPAAPRNLLAWRMEAGDRQAQLRELGEALTEFEVTQPLEIISLDDTLSAAYSDDNRLALFIKSASAVILFIALLGVFSLSAFLMEMRRKEMGIRKLLGAEKVQLMWLVSKSFMLCLVPGVAIGGLLSYYFLHKWIEAFAYFRQPASWYLPVAALALALLILAVIFRHVNAAASTNPAEILREE